MELKEGYVDTKWTLSEHEVSLGIHITLFFKKKKRNADTNRRLLGRK